MKKVFSEFFWSIYYAAGFYYQYRAKEIVSVSLKYANPALRNDAVGINSAERLQIQTLTAQKPFSASSNFPHPLHVFLVSFAKTASSGNLILFPSQISVPLLKTLAHGQLMPTFLSILA